jgi:hypothetical protein
MRRYLFVLAVMICATGVAQTPVTSIPFELFGDHIMIKVSIDESDPLNFIFDTGAGITVLDQDVANDLELVKDKIELHEETVTWILIKHNTIEINNFLMEKNIKVYATDLDHLEISLGVDFDGIVGYDLLRHHDVWIDYDKQGIRIYDMGQAPKTGEKVPFKLVNSIPVVDGNVVLNNEEPHDGTFFLMTGAGTTLDFNSPYSEKYDVVHKTGKHYSYLVKSISDVETLHYEGHVISFSFGDQVIEDLPIGISLAKSGIQAHKSVSGIVGNQLLSMYNMIFAYSEKAVYLQRNRNWGQSFQVNCSGIDIQLSEDKEKVLIHQVFEDSPASEAGIIVNAELVSINGTSVNNIDMPDIKKMLRQEGETVELVVNQNGTEKTAQLTLRSLIE